MTRSARPTLVAALLAGVVVLSAAGARAQDDAEAEPYARNGVYVGLAGSVGFYTEVEDDVEDLFVGSPSVDVDDPLGLNTRLGYRIHPRLAGELAFEWLSDADIEVASTDVFELELWTLTANAKGFLLTGRVQPFLLVGVGLGQADLEDTLGLGIHVEDEDFVARFGGGIDLYATEHVVVALDASYVLTTGDLDGLDYVSFGWGFQYRF